MANFLLTQTGEEVQTILNEAPETKEGLQQEVTNREQAITAEEQARNEAIAAAIEAAIVNYYTKTETDTKLSAYSTTTEMQQAIQTAITAALTAYSTTQDMNAAIAAALGDYYTKDEVTAIASLIDDHISALASRVSDIESGETPAKLAENLESWAERGETPQSEEWTDVVRTTGGDMSIDSSRGAKLLSVIPQSRLFSANALRSTGFNLLHDAVAVGSGYYFEVPELTFGVINTAEENNGVLFTAQNGDNLRPVVYFKPLTDGVPAHANDGEVCAYTDAGGYRFYTCNEPGYIIVSNITLAETCAHIAWSRRYNDFIAPDAQSDAGSQLPLASLIHLVHDYDVLMRLTRGEEYVYDELRAVSGNVNWYRRTERIQPTWETQDNGDDTYTHTATIEGMKADGIAQCGSFTLSISGTTISYTDDQSEATADYVLYQLATPVSGSVEQTADYTVEDWGLEILTNVSGTAYITSQYYQALPDAVAALLSKVPALREALTQEQETRVQNEKQLRLDLEAEEIRAKQAEQTLQGNIDAEELARQQADQTLQSNIDAEELARQQADQTLQGNIDAEVLARQQADQTLQGNIDSEQTARENADAAINAKIPQAASASNLLVDRQYLAEQIAAEVQARMGADADLQALIDAIVAKIPAAATAQNQLADKAFVNSSIASNTGSLITDNGQPFASVADLEAYSGMLNNNDYAFVVTTDGGNTVYNRYKYNATSGQWAFEYALNNSSFTAAQFAAINSGITAALVSKLGDLPNATDLATQISTAITNALVNYYTKSEIDTMLAGYYTKTQIDTLIANYSTTTQMNTAISDAIATALADYYTKTDIDTLIADYSTTAQMTTAITNALASYYTKTEINTLIADYSTTSQMNQAISSAISTALASYSTTQQMNTAISTALASYYTKTEIDNLLTGYATTGALSSHTGNTTVHITAAEHEKLDALPTNAELSTKFYALTRHTRLTDFDLNVLKQAVADQNLEKYGLKVGDQKTINGHTYVIAGLNPMKGTSTPYRVTANHVGLIVIPHTTHVWNADGKTTAVDGGHGAGYMNSELHAYLKSDILPMCNTDLGSANLIGHSKLLTNAVNTTGINRFGEATGCSSGWAWEADCKICALSEVQVYGSIVWSSSGFDTGEACRQLDVFQAYSHTEIFGGEYPWLRDVVSASNAANAADNGCAGLSTASDARYVAALILFH